ncbi:MAG: hypothetical protein ETSY1_15775 [Candidatus Entotheonella factor]|uniref:Major facilitator superfamily (MFS) profile domain-containing protein n=2 Tax=Candidatus Entotheonella TaxID=93171 RepID=W4LMP1_ENTF1|nr:MAG: hypothetical protein ETSY1_15775 [Candidatus Entotheonella factor]
MTPRGTATEPRTIMPVDTQAPHYKWLVATIVVIGGATQVFAGSSVNLAIPSIMATFGAELATAQWVATGFLLARTLIMPVLGWLGAYVGNRNLFVAIMAGFVVASIGCGLSGSLPMLIGFRILQGLVLGPMEGISTVLLVQAFPANQRGLALGLRTIGWSAGQVIFFVLGGYFIQEVSWRLVFFLGLPIALGSATLGFLYLPQHREAKGEPVDFAGLTLLGGFLVPLLLAISFARDDETAVSTLVLLGLCTLVGGVSFVVWEWVTDYPVVNLRLFRNVPFSFVCFGSFLNNLGLFGAQFMVPIFLQQVLGYTPFQAGLIIMPALIISGLGGVITGRLTDVLPPPVVIISGLLMLMAVFYGMSTVTVLTSVSVLVFYITLYRICLYGITTPTTALNVHILETDQVRMGQGLLGVVRSIGSSLGVTVTSVFFARRQALHQLQSYDTYDVSAPAHAEAMTDMRQLLSEAGLMGASADQVALRTLQRQMQTEAMASGFRDSFLLVAMFFSLACLLMGWIWSRGWHRPRDGS